MMLGPRDALIVADVQNDFLPGGTLGIAGADAIVPTLNEYIRKAVAGGVQVFAVRDWHPPGHCSFQERGGRWPPHCVQGTRGAEFAPGLRLPQGAVQVTKGSDPDHDAYSAFDGTKLDAALRGFGVERVLIGGLATDYCVLQTARDARAKGYAVVVLEDATRGVDPDGSLAARKEMVGLGATPTTLATLASDGARAAGVGG
jgi:nicotinamidase/pyrazinamidase